MNVNPPQEEEELSFEQLLVQIEGDHEQAQKELKEIDLLIRQSTAEVEKLARRNAQFATKLRQVETELKGSDLRAMELRPGPIFRRVLEALRDARLDGQVSTREEEVVLLGRLLAAESEEAINDTSRLPYEGV